jgi:hypothetical protein
MSRHKPTREETAVIVLAQKHAEHRSDLAQLIFGDYPGWFYRSWPDGHPADVYLYAREVDERTLFACVHGAHGLSEKLLPESLLFQAAYSAFYHGAFSVEVRPMSELDEPVEVELDNGSKVATGEPGTVLLAPKKELEYVQFKFRGGGGDEAPGDESGGSGQ